MAIYLGTDAHLYRYVQDGCVLCLCGEPVMLADGAHYNCPRNKNAGSGFPVCRFCGEEISNVNPGGSGTADIVLNPKLNSHRWKSVACRANCGGYAYDGVNPANPKAAVPGVTVAVAKPKRVMSPDEVEYRRVIISERIKQVLSIGLALGHDGARLPEIDMTVTEPLKLICAYCKDHVEVSMETHPSIAYKGPVVQFRCKNTPQNKNTPQKRKP